jgi:hypothetical protein
MFTVHHLFPSTGEWAAVSVDTLEEAELWYVCQSKARNVIQVVLTLFDADKNILKQKTIGK